MIIWLDDLRDPKDYGHPDAVWVKTRQDFSLLVMDDALCNSITDIHFDNDLGEDSWGEGYDSFCYVEQSLFCGFFKSLKTIYVHTSNPAAARKFMLAKDSMAWYGVSILRNNY